MNAEPKFFLERRVDELMNALSAPGRSAPTKRMEDAAHKLPSLGVWIPTPDGTGVFNLASEAETTPNVAHVLGPDADTQWANAQMIAASTDMYHALQELVDLLVMGATPTPIDVGIAVALAERALARARCAR